MDDFERAVRFVLEQEGGYSDNSADPGGATNMGITQQTFDEWRGLRQEPLENVQNLHVEEAERIYKAQYWAASAADQMEWPLSLVHFDGSVNHGPQLAGRLLQKAINKQVKEGAALDVDGIVGPKTLAATRWFENDISFALENMEPTSDIILLSNLIDELLWQRLALYRQLSHGDHFWRIWTKRLLDLRGEALG